MDKQCPSCGDIINPADAVAEPNANICGACYRDFAETAADPVYSNSWMADYHGGSDDIPF